jgi:DNA polymerase-3 subunit delta
MYFREMWKEIQQNKPIHPVYLLYGTESFLMNRLVHAIRSRVVPEEDAEFLYSKFDYDEIPISTVILEAETAPFFGDRRLIVVDQFSPVTALKSTAAKGIEHDLRALESYLNQPAPYTVLVLLAHADKLDERKKLTKLFQANAKVCGCLPMKMEECRTWVEDRLHEQAIRIDRDAAELIVQMVGTDLQLLDNEMEKLVLYAKDSKHISTRNVHELVAKTAEQNVFTFVDHVVRKRMDLAVESYHDLILQKESPIYLLFMIVRQFRLILQTMLQSEKGYSQQQIASQLGAHPYGIKIAAEQGRLYTKKSLAAIIEQLAELDYRIKSGQENDKQALERFMLSLPHMTGKEKSGLS